MKKRSSILLVLCLCAMAALALLAGIAAHSYRNPSKWKPLLERAVSGFTGAECSILEISWSRKPLTIQLKGIQLMDPLKGFQLDLQGIKAALSIEGPLGGKRLIFQDLQAHGLTLSLQEGWRLPEGATDGREASLLRRISRSVFSLVLFKDVIILKAGLKDGYMKVQEGSRTITLQGIRATWSPERFLEARFGAHLQSLSEPLDLRLPLLKLSTEHAVLLPDPVIQATLAGEAIRLETPHVEVADGLLSARITYRQSEKMIEVHALRVSSDATRFPSQGESAALAAGFLIEARAGVDLRKATLTAPWIHGVFGDLAEFNGELLAGFSGDQGIAIQAGDLTVKPQSLFPMLPEPMRENLQGIAFEGPIAVRGRVEGRLGEALERWTSDLKVLLLENQVTLSFAGAFFRAVANGELRLKGPLLNPEIALALQAAASEVRVGGLETDQMEAALSLKGIHPAFEIQEMRVRTAGAKWPAGHGALAVPDITLQGGKGNVNLLHKSLRLPEISLQSGSLQNLFLSLETAGEGASISFRGKDLHLAEFARVMGLLPQGLRVTCKDSLQGRLLLERDGRITVDASLDLRDLSLESEDGVLLVENLSLEAQSVFQGKVGIERELNATLFLNSTGGEILYDRFYLDLGKHNLVASGKGSYTSESEALHVSNLQLSLKELASLAVKGMLSMERPETSRVLAHVAKTPLEPLFRQFVLEPYRSRSPFLTDLKLAGFVAADLEWMAGPGGWAVQGRTLWHEGNLAAERQGIFLEGIELDLPIWHKGPATGSGEMAPSGKGPATRGGSLFIQSLRAPFLLKQPVRFNLTADPDTLTTTPALGIRAEGGTIDIGRITVRDAFSGSPDVETSLTLHKLDLGPWLSALWPTASGGTLQGRLDPVRWRGDAVLSEGELVADLFGGRVKVSNLGAKKVASLAPMMHLDASWEDIDLGQLTRDTAFGRIEGTLRGEVRGLEIAHGQPQAFQLTLETVKTKSTQQRISVQAVDNIARIGGGASPFSGFTGAFVSLFRELPYEKMGVKAALENDLFRINGAIREEGKEYLIKKGGFSGVDVVIGSPGSNTISFKDMVGRIRRIASSGESSLKEP